MNFKLTLTLGIVLLIIVGAVLFGTWRKNNPIVETRNVLSPQPAEITSFSYTPLGGSEKVRFAKRAGRWVMEQPVAAEVTDRVADVAKELRELTYTDKFTAEASGTRSLEYTGLKTPLQSLTFTDEKGAAHVVGVGKRETNSGNVWANVDGGNTIYVLSRNPFDSLRGDPNDFRDRTLVNVPDAGKNITRIAITRENATVELVPERPAAGSDSFAITWKIEKPIALRAVRDARMLAAEFGYVAANDFSSASRSIAGLKKPRLTVSATVTGEVKGIAAAVTTAPASAPASSPATGPARTVTLSFGEFADSARKTVFASVEGSDQVFLVPVATFDRFNKSLDDLRDRRVLPESVDTSTATEYSYAYSAPASTKTQPVGQRVQLRRAASENAPWNFTLNAQSMPADGEAVTRVLDSLKNLSASDFPSAGDLKSLGLESPRSTIAIKWADGKTEELLIGAEVPAPTPDTPAKTAVMRKGEPSVLVPSALLFQLEPSPLGIRSKDVLNIASNDIRTIAVTGTGTKPFTLTRTAPGKWSYKAGDAPAVDADIVKLTSLLADLTPITANSWLRMSPDPALERGNGEIVLTINTEENKPMSLPATAPGTQSTVSALAADALSKFAPAGPTQTVQNTRTVTFYRLPTPASRPPATTPATTPAATTPATASAPATAPAPAWSALLGQGKDESAKWVFEPTSRLVSDLTATNYAAPPKPATTTATAPATRAAETVPASKPSTLP